MARRRKTNFAEDPMDLVAMLPWWSGVLLALLGHLLLPGVALQPLTPLSGSLPIQALWKGLGTAGVAKRGGNAGQAVWGCTDYPSCRGTRTIE